MGEVPYEEGIQRPLPTGSGLRTERSHPVQEQGKEEQGARGDHWRDTYCVEKCATTQRMSKIGGQDAWYFQATRVAEDPPQDAGENSPQMDLCDAAFEQLTTPSDRDREAC
jgi:hypothetical protein